MLLRCLRLPAGGQSLPRRPVQCCGRVGYCTVSGSGETEDVTANDSDSLLAPRIPFAPKRDPDAVLKALSSTVTPVDSLMLMRGRSPADPLSPLNRGQHMNYLRAEVAGKMAAQHVIKHWPKLFPDPTVDGPPEKKIVEDYHSELALKFLVEKRRTNRSRLLFKKLQEKGIPVCLETQNKLLNLLAYYGVGNPFVERRSLASAKKPPELQSAFAEVGDSAPDEMASLPSAELQNSDVEDENTPQRRVKTAADSKSGANKEVRLWRLDNFAEKMFDEMKEKDVDTYEAMICGAVKYEGYKRAFELYEEMREKGLQATVATYNSLLYAIMYLENFEPKTWDRAKELVGFMSQDPPVHPDITTMNHLLRIASKTGASSRELAVQLMKELAYFNLEPSLYTFLLLLDSYLDQLDGSILYEIVDYIEQNREVMALEHRHDILFFQVAMGAAKSLQDVHLSKRLKTLAMMDNWLRVRNVSYLGSEYLALLADKVDIETLKEEYHSLIPKVLIPMEWVYGLLFRACEMNGSPEFALELWNDVMKFRVGTNSAHTIARFCGALSTKIDPMLAESYILALEQALKKVHMHINESPPPILISQLVRMSYLVGNLDKAWVYYSYFERMNVPPTFLALSSLLKGHYVRFDGGKIVEVMEIMISKSMVLPLGYVKEILWKVGVDTRKGNELMDGFSANWERREQRYSNDRQPFGGEQLKQTEPEQD